MSAVSVAQYLKRELPYNYPDITSGWYQYVTDYLPYFRQTAQRVTIFPDEMQQYKYRLFEYLKDKYRLDYDALIVTYLLNKDLAYTFDFTHGFNQILVPTKESLQMVQDKYAIFQSLCKKEKIRIDFTPF